MSKKRKKQNPSRTQGSLKAKGQALNQSSVPQYRPQPRRIISPQIPIGPNKTRYGRRFWVYSGVTIIFVSAIGRFTYAILTDEPSDAPKLHVPDDVSDRYNRTAKNYDSEIESVEKWTGIGWLRSWLAKKARGNVLEVSVGTGRNFAYYDLKECKSITMLDQSSEMMEIAREKFRQTHPKYKACRFVTQSAHDSILAPPGGFNTIVETMGLCSTLQPVPLLKHLGSIIDPDHGQILLLEHGRSHYAWLNRLLDRTAPQHADKHGCWWNKDIGKIVEDSGLEIVKMKRYHLGTTWWIELKAKQNPKPTD